MAQVDFRTLLRFNWSTRENYIARLAHTGTTNGMDALT
jgi:hypothetical protein